jgi:hypothetical protein
VKPRALTDDDESSSDPWYASVSFWTGPFTLGVGLVVAVGLGIAWYILGGFPRDHDKYGTVSVPGQQVLELPVGDVRVNFENDTTGSGDTRSIRDRPHGLAVRILPADGGEEIAVIDVPGWLFSSIRGDRGHEPFGKVEIPSAGSYRIQVTDDDSPGFEFAAASRFASAPGSGPDIALGQRPWSPLDSVLLGAILAGLAVFLTVLLLTLPVRLLS